jgi:hypothetical protein
MNYHVYITRYETTMCAGAIDVPVYTVGTGFIEYLRRFAILPRVIARTLQLLCVPWPRIRCVRSKSCLT